MKSKLVAFTVVGLVMGIPLLGAAPVRGELVTGVLAPACGPYAGALPHRDVPGQEGSAARLYLDKLTGEVYVSWVMTANTLSNGADRWVFGAEIDGEGAWGIQSVVDENLYKNCLFIGFSNVDDFAWRLMGGATGWTSSQSCSYGFHWEVSVGVKVSTLESGVSASATLGGSVQCSNGATLDSEVLILSDNDGTSCPPIGCILGDFLDAET